MSIIDKTIEYFAPETAPARLMSFKEKFIALRSLGVDRVLRIRFDEALSQVTAEAFIESIFHQKLGIKHIIVGDDLRFGHERRGDADLLRSMGAKLGFAVSDTPSFLGDGQRVSSTRIRQALAKADFALAQRLLGRPYTISGKVVYGQQLGTRLEVPTANIRLHRIKTALSGVYAVRAQCDGADYAAVANVGVRPTVAKQLTAILEVHVLNYSGNLYGKNMRVVFQKKIRDEQTFPTLNALKQAIADDIKQAETFFKAQSI